jgi:GTP-binding protein
LIVDLIDSGQTERLAIGGRGGRGNAAFATSTNQAPRRFEYGQEGEEKTLLLELKLLADVGIIGFPNAGKSTLISVLSAAQPKIADYPFTTLSPNLGVMQLGEFESIVVADIPGLIEGAHGGSGLGDHFLRHVERCRMLLHLVDVSFLGPEDPVDAVRILNQELAAYNPEVSQKKQVLVASKVDSAESQKLELLRAFGEREGKHFVALSAVTGEGVQELRRLLAGLFQEDSS